MAIHSITVIGLGKLGLPLLVSAADRGFDATGFDANPAKITSTEDGRLPYELGLAERFHRSRDRIHFAYQWEDFPEADIYFVVVPTPSLKTGAFSLAFLQKAMTRLGKVIACHSGFPVVAMVSTVLPGDMDKLEKILEKNSGKKSGKQFGFCYNPAFIALGNVIQNFLKPDFILIGESDPKAGEILASFHRQFCENQPKICRMNFVNAEIAKISVNTYVTMKISFGNALARLCENIEGADSNVIVEALGQDRRIGAQYLRGALGYGGPCFPRDNRAFAVTYRRHGLKALSAEATDATNRFQLNYLVETVLKIAAPKETIAILGLSYKPDTDVIEESQGIGLALALIKKKRNVILFDPAAAENSRKLIRQSEKVQYAETLEECFHSAQVLVIATPWKEFKQAESALASMNGRKLTVIDCWQLLDPAKISSKIQYLPFGKGLLLKPGQKS